MVLGVIGPLWKDYCAVYFSTQSGPFVVVGFFVVIYLLSNPLELTFLYAFLFCMND